MPAVARAQEGGEAGGRGVQRVAVAHIDFSGDVPQASRAHFEDRLVEGLAIAGFEVFSDEVAARRLQERAPALADCADADCYPKMAEALQVGFLVEGGVTESNKNYDIELALINGRNGATVARSRERCETCGIAEAAEKMALATSALRTRLEALARTPARLIVHSSPSGARVTLDGKPQGTTPLDIEVAGGRHRVALSMEDYEPVEKTFIAVSGVDESLELELLRKPSDMPLRALGWTGLLLGAGLVGAAAYTASQDGEQIPCGDRRDINGLCPNMRDFDALSVALASVGAASMMLGGVWLWMASQQAPASEGARTSLLGIQGRF